MTPRFSMICIAASWSFGVVGLMLGLYAKPEYFSRFGAIVVLLAMMSEYALLKGETERLYQNLNALAANKNIDTEVSDVAPSKWNQKKGLVSHVTVVVGTFIWGFGDLWLQ